MIITTMHMVARTVGMTGSCRCAVLLSPRLGNLPCRRREGGKNAASKEGTGLGHQRWDGGNGWRTQKPPNDLASVWTGVCKCAPASVA